MASIVDICNLGLSHLGNKAQVVSISPVDGSVEADYCARFYPIARDEILEMADWTFARKRAALAALSTNPSGTWQYAYALPADMLVPRRIMTGNASMHEDDSPDFDIEGTTLLTNEADAILVYTAAVDDPTRFSASFSITVSYKMGAYLAGPLLRAEAGSNAAQGLHNIAKKMVAEAMATDANRAWRSDELVPSMVYARTGTVPPSAGGDPLILYPAGYAIS